MIIISSFATNSYFFFNIFFYLRQQSLRWLCFHPCLLVGVVVSEFTLYTYLTLNSGLRHASHGFTCHFLEFSSAIQQHAHESECCHYNVMWNSWKKKRKNGQCNMLQEKKCSFRQISILILFVLGHCHTFSLFIHESTFCIANCPQTTFRAQKRFETNSIC